MKKIMKLCLAILLCTASLSKYASICQAENEEAIEIEEHIPEEQLVEEESDQSSLITPNTIEVTPFGGTSNNGHFETDSEGQWWVTIDGGIRVAILNYDPTIGWKAGISYQVKVTVDFVTMEGINREVKVTIPEGLKYTMYEVKGTPAANSPEKTIAGINDGLITSSTNPKANAYYKSYYGSLIYQIKDTNAQKIEFSVNVTPDEAVYYGPKTFTEGIKVTATNDGNNIGDVTVAINAIGEARFVMYSGNSAISSGLENSDNLISLAEIIPYRAGDYYGITMFYKEVVFDYYYPSQVNFVSTTNDNSISATGEGYVQFTNTNQNSNSFKSKGVNINLSNVISGTYVAPQKAKATITMYDGVKVETTYSDAISVNVLDSSISNKLDILGWDRIYTKVSDDYQISGPGFQIGNGNINTKTNQYMEIVIDPNYEVSKVFLPYDVNEIIEIYYKTNLDTTLKTASGTTIKKVIGKTSVSLSKDDVNLASNEYFTFISAKIGDIDMAYNSGNGNGVGYINATNSLRIIGKLTDGVDEAEVSITTYSKDVDGMIDSESQNSKVSKVIRDDNAVTGSFATSTPDIAIPAGETKRTTFTVGNDSYLYGNTIGAVNPKLYIKLPEHVTIPTSSVRAISTVDGVLSTNVQYVTSSIDGANYIEIEVLGNVGSFFNNNQPSITVSLDIQTSVQAKGNYKWEKYAFWDLGKSSYAVYSSNLPAEKNVITLGDVMVPVGKNKDFIITPKEQLIVDSYLTLEGDSTIHPAYDGTKATAVGFTPASVATYTVDIFNNRKETVKEFTTYVPIPKYDNTTDIGNDFGDNFQKNPFQWNMRLSTTPILKVYDVNGNDVTATKGSNYAITYSSDASNSSNYETASYGTTFSATTSMIKVTNTSGNMVPGEKAVIEFQYMVDERQESVVEKPEKLGAINDFNPYYVFDAGSIGADKGTSVGAILEIGEVKGKIFLDKDYDGIMNGDDTWITGGSIALKKMDGTLVSTTITNSSGEYVFSNLAAGKYQIDYTDLTNATTPYFTFKNKQGVGEIGSIVENVGTNVGTIVNVDPTSEDAKQLTVGLLDYNSFSVNGNDVTVKEGNEQQSGTTAGITPSINIENFERLKATTSAITYTSNNTDLITVSGSGVVLGKKAGTTTVTIQVKDIFGNIQTKEVAVTVTTNSIPNLQLVSDKVYVELGETFDKTSYITSVSDVEDTDLSIDDVTIQGTPKIDGVGTFTLTYKIVDSDANDNEKNIEFTVRDTTNPIFTVENETATLEINGHSTLQDVLDQLGEIIVSDNDSSANLTITSSDFALLDQTNLSLENEITLEVSDPTGNTTEVTISVDIVDRVAPVITTDLLVVSYRAGTNISEEEFFEEVGVVVIDNSKIATTVTSDFSEINFDPEELMDSMINNVTITATDSVGNVTTKVIQVIIVRKTLYYIEGNDIELGIHELTSYINEGTLNEHIIAASEVKAWKDDYFDGITDLPVYIRNLDDLKVANAGDVVTLDVVLASLDEVSLKRTATLENTIPEVVGKIIVTVLPEPQKENEVMPEIETGDTTLASIPYLVGMLCVSMVLIFMVRKEKKRGIETM